MSTIKPLAEVEPLHNPGHYHHGRPVVRVGGRHVLPLSYADDPGACRIAEAYINDAHQSAVSPLLALLARARNAAGMAAAALRRMDNASRGLPLDTHEARDTLTDVCEAIDAANPGEWVPAERLKECLAVLADLREEKADVWRVRAARALDLLRMGGAVDYAMAALEGKDE